MNIEPLEPRIAPAVIVVNPTTATWLDVDGDLVTMKISKPAVNSVVFTSTPVGLFSDQVTKIDLTNAVLEGVNVTITAKPSDPGGTGVKFGDGLVNVGYIEALGLDLGNVTVKGDLAKIISGDGDPAQPGLKTLTVRSMGRFGTATGAPDLSSFISDRVGALVVQGDVVGAQFFALASGQPIGIGSVTIAGSLIGAGAYTGEIASDGAIGPVKIGKDIRGGTGERAGSVHSDVKIASVTVGGAIIGGSAERTGAVYGAELGPVKVGRDLIGGPGGGAGSIQSTSKIASVTIKGSVIGAAGPGSGSIGAMNELGPVKIGRDLVGGGGYDSGSVSLLGLTGKIVSVAVGGSVIGGGDTFSGSIHSSRPSGAGGTGSLGNVTIGGSLIGGAKTAAGAVWSDGSLGLLKIRGDVHGDLAGGYIQAATTTAGIAIGGSLIGGSADFTGAIFLGSTTGKLTIGGSIVRGSAVVGGWINAGAIDSMTVGGDFSGRIGATSIGALTIKGSIVGSAAVPTTIGLNGMPLADPGFALGSLTVGGRVEWAVISAANANPANVQIGKVKVGGDWIASSLGSGVNAGAGGLFGDGNDALFAGNISRIAAIIIGGAIIGTPFADSYAFTAHEILSFKASGKTFPLTASNLDPTVAFSIETGGDVKLREI